MLCIRLPYSERDIVTDWLHTILHPEDYTITITQVADTNALFRGNRQIVTHQKVVDVFFTSARHATLFRLRFGGDVLNRLPPLLENAHV